MREKTPNEARSAGARLTPYQRELVEFERRDRMKMRIVSCVGAATVGVVALWSAGFPPTEWLNQLQARFTQHEEHKSVTAPNKPSVLPMPGMAAPTTSPNSLPGTDDSISPVPLPLMLVSTSPGRSASEGTANIGTSALNPQTYVAGAMLVNGTRLVEIHKNYVVLQRGDERARLTLVGPEGAPSSVANDLLTVGGETHMAATVVQPSHEAITDYIRPNPVYDGETLRGYEVYAGQNAGVFSQMGLQAGDVVIALNDVPLDDPSQALDLFRQIASGLAVTATIDRKGKRERIALDGSLIAADQERKQQAQAQAPMMPPPG